MYQKLPKHNLWFLETGILSHTGPAFPHRKHEREPRGGCQQPISPKHTPDSSATHCKPS